MALSPGFNWDALRGIDWNEVQRKRDAGSTPAAPAADAAIQNSLSPADIREFFIRGKRAHTDWRLGNNDLDLAVSRFETDFGRTREGKVLGGGALGATLDKFKDARHALPNSFVNRGLMNSGIFKDALSRHFTTKRNVLDDLEIQFTRNFQDFDNTRDGLQRALSRTIADVETDKQLRRSMYAAMIRQGGGSS